MKKELPFIMQLFCRVDKRMKVEIGLLLILCIFALITIGWNEIAHNQLTNGVEQESVKYLDDSMHRAGAAFLIARALNATISVMQSFTITPFIGELSLGEILDPINDLVERFSWIMLIVTVSLGIQKLFLEIGATIDLTWVIVPALFFILISLFTKMQISKHRLRLFAYKLLLLVLVIRFAVPITGLIGSYVSSQFLAERHDYAMQSIEKSRVKMADFSFQDAATAPKESFTQLQKDSERMVEQIITLITIFLFETVLFPLLILWGLIKTFSALFYVPLLEQRV